MRTHNTRYALTHRCWPALGLCIALLLPSAARAIGWSADLGITYDNNVTLAEDASDILSDTFVSTSIAKSFSQALGEHSRLIYRPFVQVQAYDKYDGLSFVAAGVNITYQYRSSGAVLAPTWGVFAKSWIEDYKSDFRDSTRYSFGTSVRRVLTDRLTFAAVLSANTRESDGLVWDTRDRSLLLNLDYELARRAALYITLDYRDGDIVSTAVPTLRIVNTAQEIQPDDAFGGSAANRFAYRLKGQTLVGKLGLNFRLNEADSLDLSAWYAKADADGIRYDRTIVSVAYLTRF